MTTDPFSDILKLSNAETFVSGGFTAGGSWAIRFPAPDKIKFFALVKGKCWLLIDNRQLPVRVEEGDVFLLSAQHRSFSPAIWQQSRLTRPPYSPAPSTTPQNLEKARTAFRSAAMCGSTRAAEHFWQTCCRH